MDQVMKHVVVWNTKAWDIGIIPRLKWLKFVFISLVHLFPSGDEWERIFISEALYGAQILMKLTGACEIQPAVSH